MSREQNRGEKRMGEKTKRERRQRTIMLLFWAIYFAWRVRGSR